MRFPSMIPPSDAKEICREIAGELRDLATWLSSSRLSPEQFRGAVLALEEAKVTRFGFTLGGSILPDSHVGFELRFAESQKLCAQMEFDPATGELAIEHVCT